MSKITLSNFAGGLNTLYDPRLLAPNQEGEPAESPDMANFDITSKGSLITSQGFELVSALEGGTEGTTDLLVYEKNSTTRFMVLANKDHYYYVKPTDFTWTDIGDYGIQATLVGGTNFKGTSSVNRAILGNNGSTTKGTFTVTVASPAVFSFTSHGLAAGDIVYFTTTGALPTGLSALTPYYVIAAGLTTNAFEVSLTSGGSAVNTTGTQSGTHTLYQGNKIYKWDGTTLTQLGGQPPLCSPIMESFMGYLFIAYGSNLYYTAIENEDNWTGGIISFPHDITGLKADGQTMQVHTYRESFTVQFYYNDAFSLSSPLKQPFKNASGCWSHKTLTSVFNDTYYLSQEGIQKFGADPNFLSTGLRINSISWKINPSLKSDKLNMLNISKSCAAFFQKKFYCAVPETSSTSPNKTYVYNWDYDAWTVRSGFSPSGFAVFSNSSNKDEFYFSSALSPALYKFNSDYSYDGGTYNRYWTSKIFNFGSSLIEKQLNWVDITGAMFMITVFYVDVTVDDVTVTYKIDNSNLIQTASGSYYGDAYYGDLYSGGSETAGFYRYGARIWFTGSINQGREVTIKVYNSDIGQPFSVDMIQFDIDALDETRIPEPAQAVTIS